MIGNGCMDDAALGAKAMVTWRDLVEHREAGATHRTIAAQLAVAAVGINITPVISNTVLGAGLDENDAVGADRDPVTADRAGEAGRIPGWNDAIPVVDHDKIVAAAAHLPKRNRGSGLHLATVPSRRSARRYFTYCTWIEWLNDARTRVATALRVRILVDGCGMRSDANPGG